MKSWTEELEAPAKVEVKPAPKSIAGMKAGEVMLARVPKPIEALIRSFPAGTQIDVRSMRKAPADRHKAEVTCPIHTDYLQGTSAEAAGEMPRRGVPLDEITPFWRALDETALATGRLAFGTELLIEHLRKEGF